MDAPSGRDLLYPRLQAFVHGARVTYNGVSELGALRNGVGGRLQQAVRSANLALVVCIGNPVRSAFIGPSIRRGGLSLFERLVGLKINLNGYIDVVVRVIRALSLRTLPLPLFSGSRLRW